MRSSLFCRSLRLALLLLVALWSGVGRLAAAAPPSEETVQGLYEGTWKDAAGEAKTEVRVVAQGKQAFKLMARRELDGKVTRAEIDGKLDKESVTFAGKVDGAEWKGTWNEGAIQCTAGDERVIDVKRIERKSPSLGKQPPEGAVVLLDGKKFEAMERSGGKPWRLGDMSRHGSPIWEMALQYEGEKEPTAWPSAETPLPAGWKLLPEKRKVDMVIGIGEDGSIEVPKGGMNSKRDFTGGFNAHLEFRCNFAPTARSQGRGNSGVDLPNGQEIQVLDSFGMGTYLGGGCGGLYTKKDPDTMEPILGLAGKNESTFTLASLPPLEWQTYDIEFRVKDDPKSKGYLTVYHNGIKIHDGVELSRNPGKFRFQDHGNAVRYRNIWVQPVKAEEIKVAAADPADSAEWAPQREKESVFTERKLETYKHGVRKEWGYAAPQTDTFLVLHPKQPRAGAPLYVVLHSAGHDVHTCLACTTTVGNHDIYHAPEDFFALYLDCRANKGDWWWGNEKHKNPELSPVDKRVVDTVKWVSNKYGIDPNRIYLCGNSMGGSGTLGIGMRHGDVFAAIKANVPAGVEHVSSRMYFAPRTVPNDVTLADPPIVVDYSAPNDSWSKGHENFVKAMNDRKYPLFYYWGPFGHANNHANIMKVNDLINSFDWLNVKKNEAYPAFTSASTNDALPWPDQLGDKKSGQVNAFFRWKNLRDTAEGCEMSLFLLKPADLKTSFTIPAESTADVSLRRLQALKVAPDEKVRWTFGAASGEVQADATGCVTIPALKITAEPVTLSIAKAK